tara:strand:- start:4158 stop:4700 length:543 start_codon:yes stop_codon:yes gene_type:complete
MIFKVVHGKKIREVNDSIDAIPEFKSCSDKVMKYIVLMYDYFSPYSRLPFEQRKEQVLISLEYINKSTIGTFFSRHKNVLKKGISKYVEIQYDEDMESLIAMKAQMDEWREQLKKKNKTDREEDRAIKVFDKMPSHAKRIKELEEIVGYREKFESDEEGTPKTALELYMETKKMKDELSS